MMEKFAGSLLLGAMLFASPSLWASEMKCHSIFDSKNSPKEVAVQGLMERLVKSPDQSKILGVLAGNASPSWYSFKWVLDAKTAIRDHQIKAQDFESLRPLLTAAYEMFLTQDYQKIIADNGYRFFEQLQELNVLLKGEIFPNAYLKLVERDEVLLVKAEQIVKGIETRLARLYKTTGFETPDHLIRSLQDQKPKSRQLIELVSNHLIATIRRPEGARFWIPITGFQNQRVTGNSKGAYQPGIRNEIEAALAGQDYVVYRKESPRLQPQYGEVRPRFDDTTLSFVSSSAQYGPDIWVIKKEVVEKRATWTPTDSFHQPRSTGSAKKWNEMFLPWSHRELMIPYLLTGAESSKFQSFYPPVDFPLQNKGYGGYYIEAQIWGPVTIRDVEAFAFTQTIPDASFVRELQSYGIEVYDGRAGQYKKYEVSE